MVTCASREEVFYGLGQQVRSRVADHIQTFGIPVGDDREIGIALDQMGRVDQLAVDLAGQRRAGQSRTDVGRHVGYRHGASKLRLRAIRQSN